MKYHPKQVSTFESVYTVTGFHGPRAFSLLSVALHDAITRGGAWQVHLGTHLMYDHRQFVTKERLQDAIRQANDQDLHAVRRNAGMDIQRLPRHMQA